MSHEPIQGVIEALARQARERPSAPALQGLGGVLDYQDLHRAVTSLGGLLRASGVRGLALVADNGPAWALADLAALSAGLRIVPLPLFFTAAQMEHALRDAGVDALLFDPGLPLPPALRALPSLPLPLPPMAGALSLMHLPRAPDTPRMAEATWKITYTSGTTGEPKGVCLSAALVQQQAQALCQASGATAADVHLSVLPLATLLENVGGLYAPLLAGAVTRLLPLASVGLGGASQFDPAPLLGAVAEARATTLILVPQMLHALVLALEAGLPRPSSLRFIAVGGAPVSRLLLQRAQALGLPVFEGYGLSECGSVVALNTPAAHRPGSVGRPLPGLTLSLGADGEIGVHGRGFLGYVGEPSRDPDAVVATGDLGHLDGDGFLHLTGRRKNLFVTAYGRNVAPEWVERELELAPAIAQAAVFGEARPFNAAVIWPRGSAADVDRAIAEINTHLPDYARVTRWIAADAPFSTTNEQLTPNGRRRRLAIHAVYGARLAALYEDSLT